MAAGVGEPGVVNVTCASDSLRSPNMAYSSTPRCANLISQVATFNRLVCFMAIAGRLIFCSATSLMRLTIPSDETLDTRAVARTMARCRAI